GEAVDRAFADTEKSPPGKPDLLRRSLLPTPLASGSGPQTTAPPWLLQAPACGWCRGHAAGSRGVDNPLRNPAQSRTAGSGSPGRPQRGPGHTACCAVARCHTPESCLQRRYWLPPVAPSTNLPTLASGRVAKRTHHRHTMIALR